MSTNQPERRRQTDRTENTGNVESIGSAIARNNAADIANEIAHSLVSAIAETLSEREAAVAAGEQAAARREVAADLREKAATLREQAMVPLEELTRTKAEQRSSAEVQLREVNERLVVAMVRAQSMTDAAESAAQRLSYMAKHDFLTGLPNRSLLTDRLAQSIALAQRHGRKVALMYLDLDHFKHINDSLGHPVGDQLLQSAARRLQECVRNSDTVCRQGGDEFVVLLADVDDIGDATLSAEKLIVAMAEPYFIGEHRLHVTISIGISIYPDDGNDAEALMMNADTAMYHAKKKGRNNFQVFVPEMNVRAVVRQSVEVALRRALEKGEFVLHYQPKVNLSTGAITGAEALIRLKQSDHPLVYPSAFVSIAEDSGLILQIGRWALSEACRQTAAWLQAGLNVGRTAVNVSAVELHSKDFLAGVRGILDDTGLSPHHLQFELTESGLMQDTERTKAILHALRYLGVQIAVDDFGTGYSGLSYLRRLPIDIIKIDQSFVQDIRNDMADSGESVLVSAIIAMGKSLKLRVVAEGIETRQQLAFLKSQHCAEGQGYIFSRPLGAEQFSALLTVGRHA